MIMSSYKDNRKSMICVINHGYRLPLFSND
nr:MAG TPA_asm: hypothetical protein [Caudoviricetes sp.]